MTEHIALVTGANKGIGFGIAKHLGLSGWKVVVGARDEQRALEAIRKLEAEALTPLLAKNSGRIVNVTVPSDISPYWHPLAYVTSKAAQNAMMGVMAIEFQQSGTPVETFSVHPGPTTTDLNGNMALPGFHDIETVGQKFAALINDGQSHQGEFIELYSIVKED